MRQMSGDPSVMWRKTLVALHILISKRSYSNGKSSLDHMLNCHLPVTDPYFMHTLQLLGSTVQTYNDALLICSVLLCFALYTCIQTRCIYQMFIHLLYVIIDKHFQVKCKAEVVKRTGIIKKNIYQMLKLTLCD